MIKKKDIKVGDVFFMKHAKCDFFDCQGNGGCGLLHESENCKGIIKITKIVSNGQVKFTSQKMKTGEACILMVDSDDFYRYNQVETEE